MIQRMWALAIAGGLTLGMGLGVGLDKFVTPETDGDMLMPAVLVGLGIALLVMARPVPRAPAASTDPRS